MKRLTRRTTLRTLGGLALATGATGLGAGGGSGEKNSFTADLQQENAVSPKYEPASCDAEGTSRFRIDESEQQVDYEIRLDGIEGVTGIHLHHGTPGENGPHLANLYGGEPTGAVGDFFSLCAAGEITSADLAPEFDGSFEEMIALIRREETYLQVHRGEGSEVIRGPLR